MGDTPTEIDACVFASLAQVKWQMQRSPWEKLVKGGRTYVGILDCIHQKGNAIVLELDSFVKVIDSFSQLLIFLEMTSDVIHSYLAQLFLKDNTIPLEFKTCKLCCHWNLMESRPSNIVGR